MHFTGFELVDRNINELFWLTWRGVCKYITYICGLKIGNSKVIICPSMLCRISLLLAGWWGLYAELSEDSAPIVAGI